MNQKPFFLKTQYPIYFVVIISSSLDKGLMGDHTCFRVNKTWEFPKLGTSFSNWRTHDNNELLDDVPVAQHAKIVPSSCSCTVGSGRLKFSSPSSFWKKKW